MVITPQKALETLTREDKVNLKKLEAQIDQNLMEGRTMIGVGGSLNPRVKTHVFQDYTRAGWNVEYLFDPSKGEVLYFAKHKEAIGFRPN